LASAKRIVVRWDPGGDEGEAPCASKKREYVGDNAEP